MGPTHDDVTFEGVATGLNRELRIDRQLIGYLRRQGLDEKQAAESKMANIPSGAEVARLPLVCIGITYCVLRCPSGLRNS